MKSSVNGMCVDSMEQPVGSDIQLNSCHGEGGNQVNYFVNILSSFHFLYSSTCVSG